MSNIVEFKKKEQQLAGGEAFCLQCQHEWGAVAETGTTHLECPECKTMKGLFKYPCYPPYGTLIMVCNCGNDLFYLTKEGHLCANCGTYQYYD